jgi:hypothetical protein
MTLVDGDWPVKISYGSTPCRGYRLVDLLGDWTSVRLRRGMRGTKPSVFCIRTYDGVLGAYCFSYRSRPRAARNGAQR